jgi:predicted N-acyltransferase
VTRGLLPVATRSGHWVRDPRFRSAIESFLARETRGVMHYMREMGEHSPYKTPAPERGAG